MTPNETKWDWDQDTNQTEQQCSMLGKNISMHVEFSEMWAIIEVTQIIDIDIIEVTQVDKHKADLGYLTFVVFFLAQLLSDMDEAEKAASAYWELLERNPENWSYYKGLVDAVKPGKLCSSCRGFELRSEKEQNPLCWSLI